MTPRRSPLLGQNVNRIEQLRDRVPALGVRRVELFLFERDELQEVADEIERQNLAVSLHTPVPRPTDYPYPLTWTFLNYADAERREIYFRLASDSVETAHDLGAEYVVVHFPGPITAECEAIGEQALAEIAHRSADALANLSAKRGVTIHIEGFGPSPFLNFDFIRNVLDRHPGLRYCFDIAHTHIAGQRDSLDYYPFLDQLIPYLGSVHLWQTRHVHDYNSYRHLALHPSQRPEHGWVDVARVIQTVNAARPDVPYVMEYPGWFPEPWRDLDVFEGVQWIDDLLTTLSFPG